MTCRALGSATVLALVVAGCGGHGELFGDPGQGIDGTDDGGAGIANDPPDPDEPEEATDWPTCETAAEGIAVSTIPDVWHDAAEQPKAYWLEGVYVTAISGGRCMLNVPCELVVQQHESYASVPEAAKHALRLVVTDSVAHHLSNLGVGDRIDLFAEGWRHEGEPRLEIGSTHPGCAKVVGEGDPSPVTVELDSLDVSSFDTTIGPILIRLQGVKGIPGQPAESFALWSSASTAHAAGPRTLVSPSSLPDYEFVGLKAGAVHDFSSVTGVFGVYEPPDDPGAKYEMIYARWMSDLVHAEP